MSVRISVLVVLAVLVAPNLPAKPGGAVRRVLAGALSTKHQQRLLSAVAAAAICLGGVSCEKINQPMTQGFDRSGAPDAGGDNVQQYNDSRDTVSSWYTETVLRTAPDGTSGDASIILNLHDRMNTIGDFRLSIDGGPYSNSIYAYSPAGSSIEAYDRSGANIGNLVLLSDDFVDAGLTLETDLRIGIDLLEPRVDVHGDQITREINIRIDDSRSGTLETTRYDATVEWISFLTSSAAVSPESLGLPSYRELHDSLGRDGFVILYTELGLAGQRAIHDMLTNRSYWASGLTLVRTEERVQGGFVPGVQMTDSFVYGLRVSITENGNTADISISNNQGAMTELGGLTINGTTRQEYVSNVFVGNSHVRQVNHIDWTFNFHEPVVSSSGDTVQRSFTLIGEVITRGADGASRAQNLAGIGWGVRFVINDQTVGLGIAESLEASRW